MSHSLLSQVIYYLFQLLGYWLTLLAQFFSTNMLIVILIKKGKNAPSLNLDKARIRQMSTGMNILNKKNADKVIGMIQMKTALMKKQVKLTIMSLIVKVDMIIDSIFMITKTCKAFSYIFLLTRLAQLRLLYQVLQQITVDITLQTLYVAF